MNKDFNFFSPYIEVRRTSKANRFYVILSAGLVFALLSGLIIWNIYSINRLEKNISEKENYLSSPEIQKSLREYKELRDNIDVLSRYYSGISTIDDAINKKDIIKTSILDSIANAMPKGIFLQSISSSNANVSLACTASDKMAIAEFERNLKQIHNFETVHVTAIKKYDSYFISTINIKIKEVADSEAD